MLRFDKIYNASHSPVGISIQYFHLYDISSHPISFGWWKRWLVRCFLLSTFLLYTFRVGTVPKQIRYPRKKQEDCYIMKGFCIPAPPSIRPRIAVLYLLYLTSPALTIRPFSPFCTMLVLPFISLLSVTSPYCLSLF